MDVKPMGKPQNLPRLKNCVISWWMMYAINGKIEVYSSGMIITTLDYSSWPCCNLMRPENYSLLQLIIAPPLIINPPPSDMRGDLKQ